MDNLYKFLQDYCHWISLNSNDTFGYACAESTEVCILDIPKLLEIEAKYDVDGVMAFSTCIQEAYVLKELDSENYRAALKDLEGYKFWSKQNCWKDYHFCLCKCSK